MTTNESASYFVYIVQYVKIATIRGHAGVLEEIVDTHHQAFVCCYPDAGVPLKFHYTVHFLILCFLKIIIAQHSAIIFHYN